MFDADGIKMIRDKITKSQNAMTALTEFFHNVSEMMYGNSSITQQLQSKNISECEWGTMKNATAKYCELINTMSKNQEIAGNKMRQQCYIKLKDEMNTIQQRNTKTISALKQWQNKYHAERETLQNGKKLSIEQYNGIINAFQSFRTKYDAATHQLLMELEQIE